MTAEPTPLRKLDKLGELSTAFRCSVISTTNRRADAIAIAGGVLYVVTDLNGGRRVHSVSRDGGWQLCSQSPIWVDSIHSEQGLRVVGSDDHVVKSTGLRKTEASEAHLGDLAIEFQQSSIVEGLITVRERSSDRVLFVYRGVFLSPPVVGDSLVVWIIEEWPHFMLHEFDLISNAHAVTALGVGYLSSITYGGYWAAAWESPTHSSRLATGTTLQSLMSSVGEEDAVGTGYGGGASLQSIAGVPCVVLEARGRQVGTVVVSHGGPQARALPTFSPVNAMLAELGFRVIQTNVVGSTLSSTFQRTVKYGWEDAQQLASVAREVNESEPALFFLGWSYGAYLAARALTLGATARGVISVSGFFGTRDLIGAEDEGVLRFARHVDLPAALPPGASSIPWLVIHGVRDRRVPVANISRYKGPSVRLIELRGEEHGIATDQGALTGYGAMKSWLQEVAVAERPNVC